MLTDFLFHHIGVVTNSIEATALYYKEAGYDITNKIFDPVQTVNICFLKKIGFPIIELIEPILDTSPAANILKKNGVSPYHFCYEVENIDEAIKKLKKKKFVPIIRPVQAIALENRLICFLFNKDIGLIELVQKNK